MTQAPAVVCGGVSGAVNLPALLTRQHTIVGSLKLRYHDFLIRGNQELQREAMGMYVCNVLVMISLSISELRVDEILHEETNQTPS